MEVIPEMRLGKWQWWGGGRSGDHTWSYVNMSAANVWFFWHIHFMFAICCFVGLIRKCHIDRHKALQLNDEIDACRFDSERYFRTALVMWPPTSPSAPPRCATPHRFARKLILQWLYLPVIWLAQKYINKIDSRQ